MKVFKSLFKVAVVAGVCVAGYYAWKNKDEIKNLVMSAKKELKTVDEDESSFPETDMAETL